MSRIWQSFSNMSKCFVQQVQMLIKIFTEMMMLITNMLLIMVAMGLIVMMILAMGERVDD